MGGVSVGAVVAALLLAAPAAAVLPVSDAPYAETVALRFTYDWARQATWPAVGSGNFTAVHATAGAFWLIGESEISVVTEAGRFEPVKGNWTFKSGARVQKVALPAGFGCAGAVSAAHAAPSASSSATIYCSNSTHTVAATCDASTASCGAVSVAALPVTGTVTAVEAVWNASAGAATLWLGSTQGLVQASWPQPHAARSVSQRALLQDVDVLTVSYDAAHDVLAVGGNASMHYQNRTLADLPAANSSDSWRADFISFPPLGLGAAVADVPTTLSWSPNGTLWIGNSNCLNARLPTLGGPYARIDGPAGLPMNNITSSAAASYTALRGPRGDTRVPASALRGDPIDVLWLGTQRGLVAHDPFDAFPFRYLAGPRYLPDDNVLDVAAVAGEDGDNAVLALTSTGFSLLVRSAWTLEHKAAHFNAILPRHDRYGLTSDCTLPSFGNGTTCQTSSSDNDGLWTSLNVVGECLRFADTGAKDAYSSCSRHFAAMKFLNDVTDSPGFMARSVQRVTDPHVGGAWANSTVYPGWRYKRDTSSDEVVGHFFAYSTIAAALGNSSAAAMHPVAAAASTGLVAEAVGLIDEIGTGLVNNSWYLIDPVTHKHTTWGVWNPAELNGMRRWADGRGLNSLQILAFMTASGRFAGKPSFFADATDTLLAPANQYGENMVNAKITLPHDDNFSDDELAFLPYFTLLANSVDAASDRLLRYARASLQRTWRVVARERPDLWSAIFLAADAAGETRVDKDEIARAARLNLQEWPLELINWPVLNSVRLDVHIDRDLTRADRHQGSRVLPANERCQQRWNANPFILDGGNGRGETDPGAWLAPYWIMRHHGQLAPPKQL